VVGTPALAGADPENLEGLVTTLLTVITESKGTP
jgi:hypothetical protein